MKKFVAFILTFSILFLGFFQNTNIISAEENPELEVSSELEKYLEDEKIEHIQTSTQHIFSSVYDNVKYELVYYKADGTFESMAYDVDTGKELDIRELERTQNQKGQLVVTPNKDSITPFALPIVLVPIATWVFEHLIAMAIAATLVSIVVVTKDAVKSELETRLKQKNPTIIYRGGSSTAYNHTPKPKDTKGLSYFRKMPTGKFTATTKEAVDKTKVLKAVIDGTNHVTVTPVNSSELKGWIDSSANADEKPHKFTKILQAISVSSKN